MISQEEIDSRKVSLSETKRALLRARLQGRGRGPAGEAAATIPRRPPGAHQVLSFAQQRLWFLDQLVRGSAFYTESSAVRIPSALSVPAFKRALNEIVRRHEVLRTTFRLMGDQPVAVVSPELHLRLEVVDLTSYAEAARQERVVRLATDEAQRPFDLERGPLLRTTLLRLEPAEWVFLLSIHHIVCDGWSSSVFAREMSEIYGAFLAGKPSPLDELPIQYADFAHWQREWLQGGELDRQLGYWREQLADLPVLELPSDRPRSQVFSYLGAHHSFSLSGTLVAGLERLTQNSGATLFMTLLAGFKVLLHRYSSQDDLVVGVPVANRNRGELEKLIGFFVNILVMRTDLSGSPSLREVLQRVKTVALDAYAHQDLPFETLVEALHPKRDLTRNPLFQVIFQLHENPAGARGEAGTLALVEVDRSTVKFDLRVDFFKEGTGLRCVIEYCTDLFTAERVDRLAVHLRTVYDAMARDADQGVGDFPLVTGAEKSQLEKWGGVRATPSLETTIHARFEAQVSRTPNAIAVIEGARSVSYAELDGRASLLADSLRMKGVLPDELVAVSSAPHLETIVALLGILKAGGAYLPLNSSYPDERIRYMVSDAGARFLVNTGQTSARFGTFGLEVVPLDAPLEGVLRAPRPHGGVTPDHLAYAMYTSGSTGIPKGTCIPHCAVVRLVTDPNFCSMSPGETFLLLAPLTFDATTFEIWGPLLNGGRLVIYPEQRVSLEDLEQTLTRHAVNTLWLSAGLFHQIADNRPEMLAGVKQLLAGGDVLSPRHVRNLLDRFPASKIINGYGPTENTTFTCCHVMTASSSVGESVSIGSPITRTHVHVVDRYNQLAPVGVTGELCAAGEGLARCYLNDPSLTAQRFVPDPFSATPGRMYRTGDLVRFLPSGNLEFISRIDNQLKIRGYRVEPGEVEKALLQHPAVRDAVVLARDRHSEDKQLTVYVVPKPPGGDDGDQTAGHEIESVLTNSWQSLYDELYASRNGSAAPDFDVVGWKSSETGDAIPIEQMREWVNATVHRIQEGPVRRILEIGCGTGLLAHRLAPDARLYVGIDFSAVVIDRLRASLEQAGLDSSRARLTVQPADDFAGIEAAAFDVVVINSTAQYFPGVEYLLRVLDGAVKATAPGGRIFIGDIRSLPHLEPFHTELSLSRADDGLDCAEVVRRIGNAVQLERELVLDSDFFEALPHRFGRITHVDVQWKRGLSENELMRYRYDAVLHVESNHRRESTTRHLDWDYDRLSLAKLANELADATTEIVVVHGVPNDRVAGPVRLWSVLLEKRPGTIRDLRAAAALPDSMPRLDEFWRAGEGAGFTAHVRPAESRDKCLVRYVRQSSSESVPLAWNSSGQGSPRPWREYANNPLKPMVAERLAPYLRRHLAELLPDYMLPTAYVVVDALPLTPNGKVDRAALVQLGVERLGAAAEYVVARSDVEARLTRVWADVLGLERVGVNDNFFELGGDSILCIQVVSRAKASGVHISVKQLFENQTIAQLATVAAKASVVHAEQGFIEGAARLTPAQSWLLDQHLPCVHHFNQSILLETPNTLNAAALDGSLRELVRHHDGLRLRCVAGPDGAEAFYAPWEDRTILERQRITGSDRRKRVDGLEQHCTAVQAGLNITAGPVLRAVWYDFGPDDPARLLLAVHHLVVDGVSWRILLEDLWNAYGQIVSGTKVSLSAKTTSMQHWAERLVEYAKSPEGIKELQYWRGVAPRESHPLPVDREGINTVGTVKVIRRELTEGETENILVQLPQALRTQVNDVLITALARTLTHWTGESECWFDLEGHGREPLFDDVDLSRTVGWFTSIFPVLLQVDPAANVAASLNSVKGQLQNIPAHGVGYGILRYLATDPEVWRDLQDLPKREISFNYLGQFGSDSAATIRGASESPGAMRDPSGPREYLIEVDSSVANGRLSIHWSYSEARHSAETIEKIADDMMEELRTIIEHGSSGELAEFPAADFPSAQIDQDDLERLMARLQELKTSDS